MILETEMKLDFKDILIRPRRSSIQSRQQVNLEKTYRFRHVSNYEWTGIPVMVANMDTTGTFEMARVLSKQKVFTSIHKYYSLDEWTEFMSTISPDVVDYISVTSGIGGSDLEKLDSILLCFPKLRFISLDVANGYTDIFLSTVETIRNKYKDKVIIAGTVVTREMTEELLLKGADIIRVGIGGGSVCTTRLKTGVGYPQVSAILECADAAHGLQGHIISDGGCTCPGDFGKAYGAGADFVMSGGMFSGHTESGGKLLTIEGKQFKEFYGMSSRDAMCKHSGGVSEYKTSEGKRVLIPYKGPVKNTLQDILGGIRSTCSYVGAYHLGELPIKTIFIRVSQQANEIYKL